MPFNFTPLLEADLVIQIHVYAGLLGFLMGTMVIFRTKGDRLHRLSGRFFAVFAIIVAVSSFFIHGIRMWGPFSWIHLLSIWTLAGVFFAVKSIRQGNVKTHKYNMIGVYVAGFIIAGLFTFLPGRLMHQVFIAGLFLAD